MKRVIIAAVEIHEEYDGIPSADLAEAVEARLGEFYPDATGFATSESVTVAVTDEAGYTALRMAASVGLDGAAEAGGLTEAQADAAFAVLRTLDGEEPEVVGDIPPSSPDYPAQETLSGRVMWP